MAIPQEKITPPKPPTAAKQIRAADAKAAKKRGRNKAPLDGSIKKVKCRKGRKCGAHGKYACTQCGTEIIKGKGIYDLDVKYHGGNFSRFVFCSKACRKDYIEENGLSDQDRGC